MVEEIATDAGGGLLSMLWRLIVRPHCVIGDAFNGAEEPPEELVIWHVNISNASRLFPPVRAALRCSVDLSFSQGTNSTFATEGRWTSDDGPVEYVTLGINNRVKMVPVVLRASRSGKFRPGLVRDTVFNAEANRALIMNSETLIGGNNNDVLDPGDYTVTLTIKEKGSNIIARRDFPLHVPIEEEGQNGFILGGVPAVSRKQGPLGGLGSMPSTAPTDSETPPLKALRPLRAEGVRLRNEVTRIGNQPDLANWVERAAKWRTDVVAQVEQISDIWAGYIETLNTFRSGQAPVSNPVKDPVNGIEHQRWADMQNERLNRLDAFLAKLRQ